MQRLKIFLTCLIVMITLSAYAIQPPKLRWISLSSDSRDIVHEIIRSEVDNREVFSTLQEDRAEQKAIEREKEIEDAEYKSSISAASREFVRAKKKRDDMTAQFQMSSTEYEESAKGTKTIRATIENLDSQISRYEQDITSQRDSLKRWLKTEKQGDVLVAVVYTRGFKDSAHELESAADRASAPLIAQHMGTYVQSFTKVINNMVDIDFIRTTEQGTGKWNNEEPLRMELAKSERGTSYLRLKRYELYPFQENNAGKLKSVVASANLNVAIINSREDLQSFLTKHGFSSKVAESGRIDPLIKDTALSNAGAEEGLSEQVKTFQDRITSLQDRIAVAKVESESKRSLLRREEDVYNKMGLGLAAIRERKDLAERQFQEAQNALNDKKRSHESIIIKTALVNAKGSQSPAEASAEAILDKLAEVKNDAKTQHSSSTTEVTNSQLTAESTVQSITEARIIAVRLISFLNEGESVRVKMAFRVKTILQPEIPQEPTPSPDPELNPISNQEQLKPVPPPVSKPVLSKPVPKSVRNPVPSQDLLASPVREALGCQFKLRSVDLTEDGLRLLLEVTNTHAETRKVAFYDDSFGSWTRTTISDESGQNHEATKAYVVRNGQKTLMIDIDKRGRGIEILPQNSVTMELTFKTVPADKRTLQIHLHPFIYYKSGWSEKWEEFDLPIAYNLPGGGKADDEGPSFVTKTAQKTVKHDIASGSNSPLASREALGCSFKLLSAGLATDGLHLLVEVMNTHMEKRKVAFYDDSFGSWPRTRISDESGQNHDTTKAYVVRGGQKTLMIDIDKRGRGIEILPENSVTMELVFNTVPADTKKVKIMLHPFIYYQSGRSEQWEEFDLAIDAALSAKQVKSEKDAKRKR